MVGVVWSVDLWSRFQVGTRINVVSPISVLRKTLSGSIIVVLGKGYGNMVGPFGRDFEEYRVIHNE